MFTVCFYLWLLILGLEFKIKGLYARPSSSDISGICPSTGIPQGYQRGINVRTDLKPSYKLIVEGLEKTGYKPGKQYEVTVLAQDPNKRFGDVLLWLQDESNRCGMGTFDTTPGKYLQPENCPHMVFKDTKPEEYKFSFRWTAPACGCILIRARVESSGENIYFLEDEEVMEGYLTKRVCPQENSVTLNLMSRAEKHKLLCDVAHQVSSVDLARRSYVQTRRKVDFSMMPLIEQEAWVMVFDQRLFEVQQCCKMLPTEQAECLSDVRRHRIDALCVYGESIVPFTTKRREFMLKMKEECCWRLGEGRYQCFTSGPLMDGTGQNLEGTANMDESDPVNDLEDFRQEIGQKLFDSNQKELKEIVEITDEEENDKVMTYGKDQDDDDDRVDDTDDDEDKEDEDEEETEDDDDQKNLPENKEYSAKRAKTPREIKDDKPTKLEFSHVEHVQEYQVTTETTAVLLKKLKRTKTKLECCENGKQYGVKYLRGDIWNRCEMEAHQTAKSYKSDKRRCKNYFMRCCIENSKRDDNDLENEDNDDDDVDDDDDKLMNQNDNNENDDNDDKERDNLNKRRKHKRRNNRRRNKDKSSRRRRKGM